MGDIQKLVIDGKNYVLLSEEDYEDIVDGLRADAIMARVAAGEETWPLEFVKELTETDSRIRTYRTYRGLTISELAAASEISDTDLLEIESGENLGSVQVLARIATALKVDIDDLVMWEPAEE